MTNDPEIDALLGTSGQSNTIEPEPMNDPRLDALLGTAWRRTTSEQRVPSAPVKMNRAKVRAVRCPECGAQPGLLCWGRSEDMLSHRGRYDQAVAREEANWR